MQDPREHRRLISRRLAIAILAAPLAACDAGPSVDPAAEYLGSWSNQGAGGQLRIDIEREGERLTFRATATTNGAQIQNNSARIEGGYLLVDNGGLFATMVYRKADDALHALNNSLQMPPFKRLPAAAAVSAK